MKDVVLGIKFSELEEMLAQVLEAMLLKEYRVILNEDYRKKLREAVKSSTDMELDIETVTEDEISFKRVLNDIYFDGEPSAFGELVIEGECERHEFITAENCEWHIAKPKVHVELNINLSGIPSVESIAKEDLESDIRRKILKVLKDYLSADYKDCITANTSVTRSNR